MSQPFIGAKMTEPGARATLDRSVFPVRFVLMTGRAQ